MTKNERIAALESRMTAVEQHCGIAPPADPAPATATLTVGDRVEIVGPNCIDARGEIGKIGRIVGGPLECTKTVRYDVATPSHPDGGIWYDSASLRRVQPAPDVQPAAEYFAGQAVECDSISGKVTGQFVCELDPGFYAVLIGEGPIPHRYRAAEIRPCPASAGSAVMDVQTGVYYLCTCDEDSGKLWAEGWGIATDFDPARHAVMLVPRQPAEQPAATAYCPKCHHALGQADKHGCKCAAPAEQPCTMCGGAMWNQQGACQCLDAGRTPGKAAPAEQPAPLKGDTHEQR